jgi:Domain of unknown function (DUF4214)
MMNRRTRPMVEALEGKALLSGLTETITTDRSIYEPDQPVHLTLTFSNETGQPVMSSLSDDGFIISSNGVTIWNENEGLTFPGFSPPIQYTLQPGQSFTLTATWNGVPNEAAAVPNGLLMIQVESQWFLDPSSPMATVTIAPGPPAPEYSPTLPLTPYIGFSPSSPSGPAFAEIQVARLYQTVLGRSYDLNGGNAAINAVNAGVPLSQLALGLLHSVEYETNVVSADYWNYLGRSGTSAEIGAWVAKLQAGKTETQIAADFLGSTEFSRTNASNADFIQAVYSNALGRQASAAELTAWTAKLHSGTSRSTLASDILNSTEADLKAIDGLYTTILGRHGDTAGVDEALALLQGRKLTLADIAAGLIGSPEF